MRIAALVEIRWHRAALSQGVREQPWHSGDLRCYGTEGVRDERLLMRQPNTAVLSGKQAPPTTTSACGTTAGVSSGIESATAGPPHIRTVAPTRPPSRIPRAVNRDRGI
ncbi:hypothetical protein NBRGN_110_01830 [Nocardia brasiliensis NBRC 14402]|nr:hypothetical protein NBRGN_110_01830 [Nocardia brasiliensis NBRC 14402]